MAKVGIDISCRNEWHVAKDKWTISGRGKQVVGNKLEISRCRVFTTHYQEKWLKHWIEYSVKLIYSAKYSLLLGLFSVLNMF